MPTYRVISTDGEVIETGLSLSEAAHEVLTSDGREYQIRPDDDGAGFTLWSRQQVAGLPWTATRFSSVSADRAEAEGDIFADVVNGGRLAGHCEAIEED